MENVFFVWRFCAVHQHTDLLINTAYVSSVSLSVGLFIKMNPSDLINVFCSDLSQCCPVHCVLPEYSPVCVSIIHGMALITTRCLPFKLTYGSNFPPILTNAYLGC